MSQERLINAYFRFGYTQMMEDETKISRGCIERILEACGQNLYQRL